MVCLGFLNPLAGWEYSGRQEVKQEIEGINKNRDIIRKLVTNCNTKLYTKILQFEEEFLGQIENLLWCHHEGYLRQSHN